MHTIKCHLHSGTVIEFDADSKEAANELVFQAERHGITRTAPDGFERYPAHSFAWFQVEKKSERPGVSENINTAGATKKAPRKRAPAKRVRVPKSE